MVVNVQVKTKAEQDHYVFWLENLRWESINLTNYGMSTTSTLFIQTQPMDYSFFTRMQGHLPTHSLPPSLPPILFQFQSKNIIYFFFILSIYLNQQKTFTRTNPANTQFKCPNNHTNKPIKKTICNSGP